MSNRHAKIENSERLQAVKAVLNGGQWHTTRDIMLGPKKQSTSYKPIWRREYER